MKFGQIVASQRSPSQRVCFLLALVALAVFAVVNPTWAQNPPKTHTIRVNFDYDFKDFHGCKTKSKAPCLKQFNVYNVTDTGKRILLFSIPAPPGAKHAVKDITGASNPLVFAPGKHMIAVTAQTDRGGESDPRACSTMVNVAP
jgi:hypothetical protein